MGLNYNLNEHFRCFALSKLDSKTMNELVRAVAHYRAIHPAKLDNCWGGPRKEKHALSSERELKHFN